MTNLYNVFVTYRISEQATGHQSETFPFKGFNENEVLNLIGAIKGPAARPQTLPDRLPSGWPGGQQIIVVEEVSSDDHLD